MATTLFVYGTLKRGMSHHHHLQGEEFVAAAQTLPRYRLYVCDWHPALVEATEGNAIHGELWRVSDEALHALDRFEGAQFQRRALAVAGHDGPIEGYFYLGDVAGLRDCGTSWPAT